MKMIFNAICPIEPFNSLVRSGEAGKILQKILDDLKPEAVYFSEIEGCRGAIMIVDVANSHDVPRLAEPWFLHFDAHVEFRICMTPEDLMKADLEGLGKKWG